MKKFVLAFCFAALTGHAAEFAVLQTGFRLAIDRHDREGSEYLLHANGGVTRIPFEQVAGFEPDERPPAAAPAPAALPPESGEPRKSKSLRELVTDAARRHGLPEELIHSVVAAESGYQPAAVSPKGAVGLMQLMPQTAKTFGVDARDPEQNLEAGVRYLRDLLIKYDSDANRALAAYNAGPGAVDRYGDVPPYRETQTYVSKILTRYTKAAGAGATKQP
ncbi:MAG: lytic transglycosylase domain-containing protein [Bryobacteraceae bacterium]